MVRKPFQVLKTQLKTMRLQQYKYLHLLVDKRTPDEICITFVAPPAKYIM